MQKQPRTGLTRNQEAFAQALFKGKSQRQAYYEAYPSSKKWPAATVDSKASVLAKNGKVAERLNKLNEKLLERQESKVIFNAKQLREFWTSILTNEDSGMQNRIKASELLARSQGLFVEKRESTIKSGDCVIRIAKHDD